MFELIEARTERKAGFCYWGVHMPTKEEVRKWQRQRVEDHEPPPSPEEIRRQLGWSLVEAEREQRDERND